MIVAVDLPSMTLAEVGDLRVCVGADCVTQHAMVSTTQAIFRFDEIASAQPILVSVDVQDVQGRHVAGGSTTAIPHMSQPNGPGCDPTVWRATVTVNSSGVTDSS